MPQSQSKEVIWSWTEVSKTESADEPLSLEADWPSLCIASRIQMNTAANCSSLRLGELLRVLPILKKEVLFISSLFSSKTRNSALVSVIWHCCYTPQLRQLALLALFLFLECQCCQVYSHLKRLWVCSFLIFQMEIVYLNFYIMYNIHICYIYNI